MKIRKNALMLSAIAILLIPMFAISTATAPIAGSKMTVDSIDDVSLVPGSSFSINVWVWDCEDMFDYAFFLHYDADVLNAIDTASYYPFDMIIAVEIDNDKGSVGMAYSEAPLQPGWYYPGPYPIAQIQFEVVGLGGCPLSLSDAAIGDPLGDYIFLPVENGWFRNQDVPIADYISDPPLDPPIGESVAFTSTSFDPGWMGLPDGSIEELVWDWGDGTAHGTMVYETHAWMTEGTYTVTLTVTDNEGHTDSQAKSIEITLPPPDGAMATEGWTSYTGINPGKADKIKILDFTKYGDKKLNLKAMVENLDDEYPVLVRVIFWIYEMVSEEMAGSIEMPWTWLDPAAKELFQASFSSLDYWPYRSPVAAFDIRIQVFYMDYEISPGQPHWAEVENPPELPIMFGAEESPPVPVFALNKEAEPFTYTLDASGSYDPDENWGDYIVHGNTQWVVVDLQSGLVYLYYGETKTLTFPSGAGDYLLRLRIEDTFGVRVYYLGGYFLVTITE